jgi:hypothetical protein
MNREKLTVSEIGIEEDVDKSIKNQYLRADLEEVVELQKYAEDKEVDILLSC